MNQLLPDDPITRRLMRHLLATLAYRTGKAVRVADESFAEFKVDAESRSPVDILAHMGDLMDWALSVAMGQRKWQGSKPLPWDDEITRFFRTTQKLDDYLDSGLPMGVDPATILQGGMADALTHAGQLAMLRRLAGHRMKSENYSRADIQPGRVGLEQTPPDPKHEFE